MPVAVFNLAGDRVQTLHDYIATWSLERIEEGGNKEGMSLGAGD